jgi:glycosyltransferase involved in cell wall biosynthesis
VTEGLVTTIIPVFNRAAMLREAVSSVLAQTWRPIEIIVVDDGSSDDTLAVAQEVAARHPEIVRVLSQPNSGPGAARQTGLEAARGEFIQFLDSDDLLLPQKFALQVAGLRDDADAGISYGKTYTRDHGVRSTVPAQRSAQQHRTIFPALLEGRIWETSTPLYRRDAVEQIGPWPRKRQMEDWEFDAQAGAAGIKLHYCDAFVAEYRIHSGDRLAHAWSTNAGAMKDRLSVHGEIYRCAERANVGASAPEMQTFSRTLFSLARSAGRHGLVIQARELLGLAAKISQHNPRRKRELWVFTQLTVVFGWTVTSHLSERMKKLLPGRMQ